jgi:hypothetical protein
MATRRLSEHPSAYYLALFQEAAIVVTPGREAGYFDQSGSELVPVPEGTQDAVFLPKQHLEAWCEVGADDLSFAIQFEVVDSKVYPTLIQKAKDVLGQVVEMDEDARAHLTVHDYDESLNYVRLTESEVEFRYVASTCNAEWGAYFAREADGTFRLESLG